MTAGWSDLEKHFPETKSEATCQEATTPQKEPPHDLPTIPFQVLLLLVSGRISYP